MYLMEHKSDLIMNGNLQVIEGEEVHICTRRELMTSVCSSGGLMTHSSFYPYFTPWGTYDTFLPVPQLRVSDRS